MAFNSSGMAVLTPNKMNQQAPTLWHHMKSAYVFTSVTNTKHNPKDFYCFNTLVKPLYFTDQPTNAIEA